LLCVAGLSKFERILSWLHFILEPITVSRGDIGAAYDGKEGT
jgi:hypothetical protein